MNRVVHFAIPGDLESQTGGYAYARHLIEQLPQHGWTAEVIALDDSFPNPTADAIDAAKSPLVALQANQPLIIDGLAYGAFPAKLTNAIIAPILALVHHPLALETGLAPEAADGHRAREQAALAAARGVVATSAHTAEVLVGEYGVKPASLTVAQPGITQRAANQPVGDEPLILSVGTVTRRKAPDHLIEALNQLTDLPWRAVWCGDTGSDPVFFQAVQQQLEQAGIAERVSFSGIASPDELAQLYQQAYLFALPARYEGFGMAMADAVCCGLPVVGYDAGAVS
ncbi:MAG: glycosyltransferase family 4 protein, partial [Pseudomonadota bacterium]